MTSFIKKLFSLESAFQVVRGVAIGMAALLVLKGPIGIDLMEVQGTSMMPSIEDGSMALVATKFNLDRFDIVVLKEDDVNGVPGTKLLIKRVIGLPGETVTIRANSITTEAGDFPLMEEMYPRDDYSAIWEYTLVLGDDEVFVGGDNRPSSLDSRSIGPVKIADIVSEYLFSLPF